MEQPANTTERLRSEANRIGYDALMDITARYGYGDPKVDSDPERIPERRALAYHNLQHTLRVRDTTRYLARRHGLTAYDTELAVMAACAHDYYHEHDDSTQTDEERSANWLTAQMHRAGFGDDDREIARLAILGTEPIMDSNGLLMDQRSTLTTFPSERAGEIALCVAAADLEALFAPHGPIAGHDLFKEYRGIPTPETPDTLEGLAEFEQQQITLLETYRPLYPELELLFGDLRHEALAYHRDVLSGIRTGTITDWAQITALDRRFYSTYPERGILHDIQSPLVFRQLHRYRDY